MQASQFQFQRLPSTAELNTIGPTSYDSQHARYDNESTVINESRLQSVPEDLYEPVQSIPQRWPMEPEVLSASTLYRVIGLLGHGLLTLSPIIFLMLAFAALSVNGKPLSHKGQVVIEAARVAPTLFPIIFAAVVGRLMRTYALWRAERGSSLGLLEQLNGSQNFLAAVERAFHLQGAGGIGLFIIILWGLSPLGGQSSLRVLGVAMSGSSYETNLGYFNVDNYTQSAFQGASALGYGWPTISAIYQACLLAPDTVISSSADLWGNVKIPYMQSLDGYTNDSSQDWLGVPTDPIYSSLSGIVVSGLNRNNTFNFTMETAYLNLTCTGLQQFQPNRNATGNEEYYYDVRQWTGNLTLHSNTSGLLFGDPYASTDTGSKVWSSFTVDTTWNYTNRALVNQSDIDLIYLSQNTDDSTISGYKCAIGYTHVEASINCDGLDCYVARMRPSRQPHLPSNITPFNQGFFTLFANLIQNFPWVTGQQHSAVTSPTDWYVAGSEEPYNLSYSNSIYTNVTASQVSRRLGTVLNTFWQTSMTQASLVQPHTSNSDTPVQPLDFDAISVSAMTQTHTNVYAASKLWVSFTIIISFIMTFCGIAGAFFKYSSTAPDILGYVSTLTKDNPYFDGSVGSDTLDGLERARLLQHVMVQIGNVKPWDDKGYIALRRISEGQDRRTTRLKRHQPRAHSPL